MGSCFSVYSQPFNQLSAKVITLDGSLREYSIEVTVLQVLESETNQSCFLCNSDMLQYDEFIQPLGPKGKLEMGQIYFVLPVNRLLYRLTASDMAALAVKASRVIGNEGSKKSNDTRRRVKPIRISPVLVLNDRFTEKRLGDGIEGYQPKPMLVELPRSDSVRKLQRNASRRSKLTIRSFRLRLSTIREGFVAE